MKTGRRRVKNIDFETIKKMEKLGKVNGPLIQMFNERWRSADEQDENYQYAANRIQEITQTVLDLITAGLL
jgi:hypothetical protein